MPTDWRDPEEWELVDGDGLPMAEIALAGGAFDWLAEEPDLHGASDLPLISIPTP